MANARAYIKRVEELGCADRYHLHRSGPPNETIILRHPFA